jgi:hypothetical protein
MSRLFDCDWRYAFRWLNLQSEEDKAKRFIASQQRMFGFAKSLNTATNSKWIARCYIAGRWVMASTLYVNTYFHCLRTNAPVAAPFLQYYAALFSMRAVVLTSPNQQWVGGDLLKISHSKAINCSSEIVRQLCSNEFSMDFKRDLLLLRAHRELISYVAPLSGDSNATGLDADHWIDMLTLLCEIAQLQSEILESSVRKHAPKGAGPSIDLELIEAAFKREIEGYDFVDHDDLYRLDYLRRRNPSLTNVQDMISAGEADDFFGAWGSTDDNEPNTGFDPDLNNRIIFDIP